jgi:esterase
LLSPSAVFRLLIADIAPVSYSHANAAIAAALRGTTLSSGMTRADAAALLQAEVPDAGVRSFLLQNFVPGAAPHWRIGLDFIADCIAEIEAWPDFTQEEHFEGPALFVRGGQSDYITPDGRAAAKALFPQARFLTLKDAGHWLHADQPDAFSQVAGHFLASQPA